MTAPVFPVHQGTSINLGPYVLYSHFDAANPSNNVLDTTTQLSAACGSGAARVGLLPTVDGSASRTVYVDALVLTSSPANVQVSAPGVSPPVFTQISVIPQNAAPPALDGSGVVSTPEYPTPTTR